MVVENDVGEECVAHLCLMFVRVAVSEENVECVGDAGDAEYNGYIKLIFTYIYSYSFAPRSPRVPHTHTSPLCQALDWLTLYSVCH
jgi:hypothetical protein